MSSTANEIMTLALDPRNGAVLESLKQPSTKDGEAEVARMIHGLPWGTIVAISGPKGGQHDEKYLAALRFAGCSPGSFAQHDSGTGFLVLGFAGAREGHGMTKVGPAVELSFMSDRFNRSSQFELEDARTAQEELTSS